MARRRHLETAEKIVHFKLIHQQHRRAWPLPMVVTALCRAACAVLACHTPGSAAGFCPHEWNVWCATMFPGLLQLHRSTVGPWSLMQYTVDQSVVTWRMAAYSLSKRLERYINLREGSQRPWCFHDALTGYRGPGPSHPEHGGRVLGWGEANTRGCTALTSSGLDFSTWRAGTVLLGDGEPTGVCGGTRALKVGTACPAACLVQWRGGGMGWVSTP